MKYLFRGIIIIIVLIIISMLKFSFSQNVWTKTFWGTGNDYAYDIHEISDDHYIIAGVTDFLGNGNYDALLLNIALNGDTLWTKTYKGSNYDGVISVKPIFNGGYILLGETNTFGSGGYDVWFIKTDSEGDTLWTRTYGGDDDDTGIAVIQAADSGYVILARTLSFNAQYGDLWLIRTDSGGDTIFTKVYNSPGWDYPESFLSTPDGGYIITGWTEYFDSPDFDPWLSKIDSSGELIWTESYSGIADKVYRFQQATGGGYIITGETSHFGSGSSDVLLMKTNTEGDTVWTRAYGGSEYDIGKYVCQTSDGGFIIVGHTSSFGIGDYDIYIIKTNSYGDTLWTKTHGGLHFDTGETILQTGDNGYLLAGWTHSFGEGLSDIWIIKTDSSGNTEEYLPPSPPNAITGKVKNPDFHMLHQNYPNPFNNSTKISYTITQGDYVNLEIYDILGRKVITLVDQFQNPGNYAVNFYANQNAGGVYFCKLEVGNKIVSIRKMIYLR